MASITGPRIASHAGGHVPGNPALELLEWHLSVHTLPAFQGVLQHSSIDAENTDGSSPGSRLTDRLTEKGVLQLLFDMGLARHTLAGARPPGTAAAEQRPSGRCFPASNTILLFLRFTFVGYLQVVVGWLHAACAIRSV